MKKEEILQTKITPSLIDDLYKNKLLNNTQRELSLKYFVSHFFRSNHLDILLLIFGSILILVGLIFFFAFNWHELSSVEKFLIIEGFIFLSLSLSFIKKKEPLLKEILLLLTCFLVGIFLAVFGQIYQTGANSYELFRGWALLVLPIVLISKSTWQWILLIVLTNVSIALYWGQENRWFFVHQYEIFFVILGYVNVLFLFLSEKAYQHKFTWLKEGILRKTLLPVILACFTIPIVNLIFKNDWNTYYVLSIFSLIATFICSFYYLFKKHDDLLSIVNCSLSINIILFLLCIKVFDDVLHIDEESILFLMSILVIIFVSITIRFVMKLHNQNKGMVNDTNI